MHLGAREMLAVFAELAMAIATALLVAEGIRGESRQARGGAFAGEHRLSLAIGTGRPCLDWGRGIDFEPGSGESGLARVHFAAGISVHWIP